MNTVRKIFFSCKFSTLIVNNQIIWKCVLLETVQFHYFMSWNWISNAKIALSEISSRYIDNSKCWVHLIYMTVWYRIPISSNPTIVLLEWHGKCCAIIALNATFNEQKCHLTQTSKAMRHTQMRDEQKIFVAMTRHNWLNKKTLRSRHSNSTCTFQGTPWFAWIRICICVIVSIA